VLDLLEKISRENAEIDRRRAEQNQQTQSPEPDHSE